VPFPLDRFAAADAVLAEALDRPAGSRRDFVLRACGADAELRAVVERLLAAAERADPRLAAGGAFAGALWGDLAGTMTREPSALGAGARLGPYEIVELVGEGGMGRVYRARDPRLERDVALKVLTSQPEGWAHTERFGREARAASALNHPNIVTIYDIGEAAGTPFIAMEYLSGGSVRERLVAGRLELDEALDLAAQVAQGLAAAHARGVIHRDLKPGNVMISADRTAKIVDFGLAKLEARTERADRQAARREPVTADGAIFGTFAYMSPEQATGRPVDYRSDLFSFGAMVYELVTGERPFDRGSTPETMAAILKEQPASASALNPLVPPPLEWAIDRCLAKDPANRYESTRDLARDLRAVLDYRARGRPLPPAGVAKGPECPSCGAARAADGRFCDRCGAEFQRRCPGCGGDVAAQAAFCSACGQRLVDPADVAVPEPVTAVPQDSRQSGGQAVMSGERRQATILASRISGYDAFVERAAPDEVDRVLAAFEQMMDTTVERHGGVIDRVSGEEIVALFGIPVAHEDDARRAAQAALALHAKFRQRAASAGGLQLRSAVHTGYLVVRSAPDRSHGVRVLGDALSDAIGLLRAVRDGDVLVSQETRRLAGASLRSESAGPVQVRSQGPPLVTFRVTAADHSSAPPLEGTDAPLTPFAGRQGELGALVGSLEMTIAGEGQVISVIGEAGAGKSRLLYELRRQVDRTRIGLVEGRCQSYGARVPYLPLIHCCRSLLRVRDDDPPEEQRRQVRDGVRALDRELEGFVPVFFELLSIARDGQLPDDGHARPARHAVQEALAALFSLASRRRPLLMLLEDWHWVDEASHEVVRQLADLCPSYPLMVVTTYRPDVRIDWGSLRHVRATHLTSLGPVSSGHIMRSVLRAERIDESLAARLHERSSGNPFFLEEVCRKLLEEGAVRVEDGHASVAGSMEGLQLPESVQAVIRTRLDRLDRDARDLLRAASVIGLEFTAAVLAAVAGADLDVPVSLAALKERGLIRQTRVIPEPAYRFQHALTLEVAYDSLLQRQRQILHGQVGRAIESIHEHHLQDQFGLLARHFAEAEDWPKAVEYGHRFARRARQLSQFEDARAALDLTMDWTAHLPADEGRAPLIGLLFDKQQVCEVLGDRAQQEAAINRLLAILEPMGDRPELIAAYARRAEMLAGADRFAEGEQMLERALALSRRLADRSGERDTLRSLSFLFWLQGRNDDALIAADRALALDREAGDPDRIAGDLTNRGAILRSLGRFEEAIETLEEALRIAAPDTGAGDLSRHVETLYVLHTVYRDQGDLDGAEPHLAKALEIAGEDRFRVQLPFPMSAMANLLLERGEIDRALDLFRRGVELNRQSRYAFGLAHNLRALGEVLLGLGRSEEALPYLREAADLAHRLADRAGEAAILARTAPLLQDREQNDEAAQAWQRLLDLTRASGDAAMAVQALKGLARAAERAGHVDRALRFLHEALPHTRDAQRGDLLNEIGVREWKRGNHEAALAAFREALGLFEALGHPASAGLMINSIGACLLKLGRLDEALTTLEDGVRAHVAADEPLLEGHALALLGDLAMAQADVPRAAALYGRSLEVRQRIDDRNGAAWMHLSLARALSGHDRPRAAAEASRALALAEELGDPDLLAAARASQPAPGDVTT
jgi:tetratricopeptide (TPR) repeat protein/class 3 adenylate cyclase